MSPSTALSGVPPPFPDTDDCLAGWPTAMLSSVVKTANNSEGTQPGCLRNSEISEFKNMDMELCYRFHFNFNIS